MILGTLGMTGYGVYEMLGIVDFARMTVLQGVLIFFFTITLGWIAFAAASAVAGLLTPLHIPNTQATLTGSRTALLMPIYNEDPSHTTSALQAMAEALALRLQDGSSLSVRVLREYERGVAFRLGRLRDPLDRKYTSAWIEVFRRGALVSLDDLVTGGAAAVPALTSMAPRRCIPI